MLSRANTKRKHQKTRKKKFLQRLVKIDLTVLKRTSSCFKKLVTHNFETYEKIIEFKGSTKIFILKTFPYKH